MTAVLPPRTATYDRTAVRNWLQTIHETSRGHVWIGSHHDRFAGRCFDTADRRWIERAAAHVAHLDGTGTSGIYLRTTTLSRVPVNHLGERTGRGGDNDSLTLPGLAADLDIAGPGHAAGIALPPDEDAARSIVYESGLPDPSIWVHSGGGLYAWWLLDQPHRIGPDLERVKRLAARWQDPLAAASQRAGWKFGRLGDLARILRIPGTVNRKPGMPEPALCRIVEDTGRRYSLVNLRECLHDALNAMPAPEPVNVTYRPRTANAGDDLSPGDDYEARTDWRDILLPRGWSLTRQVGRTRYWVRPNKDSREGVSATTGRAADRDRLWVFTDATELPQGTPLTKFAAFAWFETGGNFAAAARELRRLGYGGQSGRRAA